MKRRAKPGEAMAFVAFAASYAGAECLLWPFGRNSAGYGQIGGKKGWRLVHRLVCESANGAAPDAKSEAAHQCGNGHLGCCNPLHLKWRTRRQNAEEMAAHGRSQRGSKAHMAKLTAENVRFIRANAGTLSKPQLAKLFGVTRSAIHYAITGKSWAWL